MSRGAYPKTPARGGERIVAIEGARAWLAWIVVVGHVVQISGLNNQGALWHVFDIAAATCVQIFIIISGFVITGLLLTRRESWGAYITRRAFRIFPAYLIALPVSAVALPLSYATLAHMDWGGAPCFHYGDSVRGNFASVTHAPWTHALLDLTLTQGAVPSNILPRAQVAVLGPAWSLSLEWQFYLVAPFLLWLLMNKQWRFPAVAAVFVLVALYRLHAFGHYVLPSFLPGSLHFFAIGIASRLAFDAARTRRRALPAVIAIALAGMGILFHQAFAVFCWAALFVFITNSDTWRAGIDSWAAHAGRGLLESAPARALGARSYSVYIIHLPLIQLLAFFILPLHQFTQTQTLLLIGAAIVPTTLIVSELLYRFVERPMIHFGAILVSGRRVRTGERLDQGVQAETP